MGPQGCGKGTQAEMLKEKYEFDHLSAGDMLRQQMRENAEFSQIAAKYITKGEMLPDSYTVPMVLDIINKKYSKGSYILDGFPRNLEQAQALDKAEKVDLAIEVRITDAEAVKRLSSRLNCTNGHIFNKITNPPRKEGVCDVCGQKLFVRADDKPAAIKERLRIYHEETEPVLKFYNAKGILHKVDGSKKIDDVFSQIEQLIWKTKKK